MKNDGSLDIGSVLLKTSTIVTDNGDPNPVDLSKFIKVKFLKNQDKGTPFTPEIVVYETTLDALKSQSPDLVNNTGFDQIWTEPDGIKAHTDDSFTVKFEFVDNGEAQNYFQKDKIQLTWNFEAKQGPKKDY
ncbi:Camelysin metallo-endopeptidase [compost metagenome]